MPASEAFLRPKVTIKSMDGATTYHVYDSFDVDAADINISRMGLSYTQGQTPTCTIQIEDSGNTLDPDVINGCKVIIDLGKTQGGLARATSCYCRTKQVLRTATGTFDMVLGTQGSQIRFNERISNFKRMAKRTGVSSSDPDMTDTNMGASEVFKDLIQDTDHLPVGEPTESFTTTGIDSITDVIPSMKVLYTEWSQIADRIAEAVGAEWYVDQNDDIKFRFPTVYSSGLIITDVPSSSDSANTVYFTGGWSFIDSIQKSDGFANRIYGKGGTELAVDAFSATDAASTALWDRDLAIQFMPTNSFNAEAFSVVLHKVGTPTGTFKAVIRVDKSNSPDASITNAVIPLDKITTDVGGGLVQLTFNKGSQLRNIQVDKAHWLELHRIGADAANTVLWHRDAGATGRNAYKTGASWTVQSSSYTFVYAQLTSRRVLAVAEDGISRNTYGIIESVFDAPWIFEGRMMDKYLSALLEWTAKPKRIYEIPQCTIPDTLVFPGTTAELIDTKAGFTPGNAVEILGVSYVFDAYQNGLGTNKMSLKLLQYPTNERLTART